MVVSIFVPTLLLAAQLGNVYAGSDSTIYSFGMKQPLDGAVPKGSLTYVNGLLFGRTTTITCGAGSGDGVIFHFDPSNVTATYSIDHVFTGNPDGENPRHDAMTLFSGQLYGTTLEGGTTNAGVIFTIGQDGTGYNALTSLAEPTGDEPHSCFVVGNNILYGMTASGGDHGHGVIFSFDPSTSTYQKLYSFTTSMGKDPHGRLTLDPNGTTLYGMTREGGTTSSGHDAFGVVFSVNTDGSNYKVLHPFAGKPSDGATSDHGYVVQSGSWLYGMTTMGGSSNNGVIFKLMTDGSNYMVLYNFGSSPDGKNPYGSLLLDGIQLYGTTAKGGDNDMGTVFVINTDGSGYNRLHSFGSTHHDGTKPIDNVILVNQALYGMATGGGDYNQGTVFEVPSN